MLIVPPQKLGREEVTKRLKRFREGLSMSRREFGNLDHIRQRGETVGIHTDRHTIYIPLELWEELGRDDGEGAVAQHQIASQAKN